jgi:hypothetical protein
MRLLAYLPTLALVFGVGSTAHGQNQPQVPASVPTTVQLPTFSFFTIRTTVSVPDSGGMSLGGIHRGSDGNVTRGLGPLAGRASGGTRGAAGATAHATIIDRREMDAAHLAAAAAERTAAADPAAAKADALSRHVESQGPLAGSVAAIKRENAAAAAQRSREAAEYLVKAQQAEAEGKPGVAKIYYRMVISRDGGVLKQQAQVRLAAMGSKEIAGR